MYNMVGSYRTVFKIIEQNEINDKIGYYYKTVPVFLNLTQHYASFLEKVAGDSRSVLSFCVLSIHLLL